MQAEAHRSHWDDVYLNKADTAVSWYEPDPIVSLNLIDSTGIGSDASIIDIGGGASRLVDSLLARHVRSVSVLDLSEAALGVCRARLGTAANSVTWLREDVTTWQPEIAVYDLWHDRAAFHFLTQATDREAYVARLRIAMKPGGYVIIGTFALDGPERCSGLPVIRYDAASLTRTLGDGFELLQTHRHRHATPSGAEQRFQFNVLRYRG